MNREIKFRFFDKNGKKMYQAGVLDFDDKKVYMNGYMGYSQSNFLLENVELMQSTGLKDKNGVEIYENMIINNKYIVIYDFCKFALKNIKNENITDFKKDGVYEITREYFEQ